MPYDLLVKGGHVLDPGQGLAVGSMWVTVPYNLYFSPDGTKAIVAAEYYYRLDFYDPWGNRVEIVDYRDIQFSKTPQVLDGMGLDLTKHPEALEQLREKGLL